MVEYSIMYIGFDSKGREFFFADYDEAKAFEKLFDGKFEYVDKGYKVTI